MYTPLTQPVPELLLPEPRNIHPVIGFFRSIMQPYARSLRFKEPVMLYPERMVDAYHDFAEGKSRLIVGFRHAYGDDPHLMAYVFHHVLPKAARRLGRPFRKMTHAHFIYGVEVPLWSSAFVGWLLPKVGAVPVDHIRMDSSGMNRIRKIVSNGEYPLALAPEGHVTYSSETVGDLETGTARFGFWCLDDLKKQGRKEKVVILPLSQHYRCGKNGGRDLERLISAMEKDCQSNSGESVPETAARLRALGSSILAHLASFYGLREETDGTLTQERILEAVLDAAERILNLKGVGEPMERIYRIRSAGWDKIYRKDLAAMSDLRRQMAGRETGEAWYAMRHMETAELLCHIRLDSVPAGGRLEEYMEITNNFYDVIERQKGGTLRNRANVTDKYAIIVPGNPIVIDDYEGLYRTDKKAALQKATDELHRSFEQCVAEYRQAYR